MQNATESDIAKILNSDKEFFGPAGDATLQSDGLLPTTVLENLLTGSYSMIPNPVAGPQVLAPIDEAALLSIAPTAVAKMSDAMLIEVGNRIRANDRTGLIAWGNVSVIRGTMLKSEAEAVGKLLAATIPDPDWPATVPAPSKLDAAGLSWNHSTLAGLIDSALKRTAK